MQSSRYIMKPVLGSAQYTQLVNLAIYNHHTSNSGTHASHQPQRPTILEGWSILLGDVQTCSRLWAAGVEQAVGVELQMRTCRHIPSSLINTPPNKKTPRVGIHQICLPSSRRLATRVPHYFIKTHRYVSVTT